MSTRLTRALTATAVVAGAATVLLGAVVIVGWYLRNRTLIQVLPTFVPMQYNTALGFLCCGASLLFLVAGKQHRSLAFGAIACAVGSLTLVEYIVDVNLGIDEFFMKHDITVATSNPGRMAPNTAVCFALFGLSAVLRQRPWKPIQRSVVTVILGSMTFGLGVVALSGYIAGLETAYGWGNLTRMAVHTSAGFVVVSGGLLCYVWSRDARGQLWLPDWMPIPMGVAVLTATVCLWQALSSEGARIQRKHADVTSVSSLALLMLVVGVLLAITMSLVAFLAQQSSRRTKALNAELSRRREMEQAVAGSTNDVAGAAAQIAASARQQEKTVGEFHGATGRAASAVNEIAATVNELTRTMDEVNNVAQRTAQRAIAGQSRLQHLDDVMRQMTDATKTLSAKIDVISETVGRINLATNVMVRVVDQTGLLSVNSAIEAEKAGEHGRGFRVVAQEIRRLAGHTADATLEIESVVKRIHDSVSGGVREISRYQEQVHQGIDEVRQIAEELGGMVTDVSGLSTRFAKISDSMAGHSSGTDQIRASILQVDENAKRIAASSTEFTQVTAQLNQVVLSLKEQVSSLGLVDASA